MNQLELSLMEMLDNATGWKTDYVLFPIDIRRYIAEQLEYATAQDIKDMIFSISAYLQLTYSEHLRDENINKVAEKCLILLLYPGLN